MDQFGAGNGLDGSCGIAVDAAGNVYLTGNGSNNAFKITPAGLITEIIDSTGDGAGNGLNGAFGIAVDSGGNLYVTGELSNNAFKITPTPTSPGDLNCDVFVNGLDVGPFVLALLDPAQCALDFAGCDINSADINNDTMIDTADIGPFTQCLLAGGCP